MLNVYVCSYQTINTVMGINWNCVCAVEDCNCLTKQNAWQNNYYQHLWLFLTAMTSILIVPYLTIKLFQLTRTTKATLESTVNEFIDILTDKILELCHHYFIKVQQAAYLKEAKAMLNNETCILLTDFLENYSFLVQDEIQRFNWQNHQATLHPIAVYHNDHHVKLKCDCYCVILDHLLQDQTAVHSLLSLVIPTIRTRNPRINRNRGLVERGGSQIVSSVLLKKNMFLLLLEYFFLSGKYSHMWSIDLFFHVVCFLLENDVFWIFFSYSYF